MSDFASVDGVVASAMAAWKPPPRLSLSEWAERHFYLSAASAAEPGRWKTLPYQKGIMDALTDPTVTWVSVIKSARVGWTKILNAFAGYSMHQDPCPILIVQPTVEDAKGYSKEEIAPMLRDCPALREVVLKDAEDAGPKDSGNTILHKEFPGGVLSLVGANSGTGFRRVSRKRVLLDEVDAYPASAGDDGDPVTLAARRSDFYWDRKICAGSTPLVAGASRIEDLFAQGDQRRYFVPCPHCGHKAPFVFREPTEEGQVSGHALKWPDGQPEAAFFACEKNGCVIEHKDKMGMVAAGEWRAAEELRGHASFHVWAAVSFSPNATWADIATEFLKAKADPEKLKTFVNTWLGETWKEKGEAPAWRGLYDRREQYAPGTVPASALLLTCGVDVQKDRWVYEVVAWGAGKESWSVDVGVIPGDTSNDAEWKKLDDLLGREYPTAAGGRMGIRWMAVDSGFNTNAVYAWVRKHVGRAIAVKGIASRDSLLGAPTVVEVKQNGLKLKRGAKVWPVGTDMAKAELYGWLRLDRPEPGQPFPPGWCHFPEWGEDYFKQLTAEHLVTHTDKRGFTVREWQLQPGRENHWLDCRIYARAAAALAGLDRMQRPPLEVSAATHALSAFESLQKGAVSAPPPMQPPPPPRPLPRRPGGFFGGRADSFWGRGRG